MKHVCGRCIEEPALARFIGENSEHDSCDYCGRSWKRDRAARLQLVISYMKERIEADYEDPANSVGYETAEGGYQLPTTDTWDLLRYELDFELENQALWQDLHDGIGEGPWVHKDPYSLTTHDALKMGWDEFVRLVTHRVRYLMFPAATALDHGEVTAPSEVLDELGQFFHTYGLFAGLETGTKLYRVRIHSPHNVPSNTLADLGPPTGEHARFANRMSPAGVGMFYAAMDPLTAEAETVVRRDGLAAQRTSAVFSATKDLVLLDLVHIPDIPSFFESTEANSDRAERLFLAEFVADLTRPVVKDGREHVEYVPSQIVTEFVRHRVKHEGQPVVGIQYRSARRPSGVACVLFYDGLDIAEMSADGTPFELLTDRTETEDVDTAPE